MGHYAFENLFGIQGFNIAWYGIIIACGMVLGVLLAMYRAKQRGFKPDMILDFMLWAIPLAIIGGIIAAIIFCKIKRFPFFTLIDLAVPSLILGQAIGRWGNFVNQEAFRDMITNPSLQFFSVAVYIEQLGEWHTC
jgi:phosphatidylglycerol:prolipoprotein diacylglycerol transferase